MEVHHFERFKKRINASYPTLDGQKVVDMFMDIYIKESSFENVLTVNDLLNRILKKMERFEVGSTQFIIYQSALYFYSCLYINDEEMYTMFSNASHDVLEDLTI